MKKINVNKSDEVALIVEKLIEASDEKVELVIPRFSHIGESLSNFHLLKREADALGKDLVVESVDDRVIELAEMSGLATINPFFAKSKRQFSDIVVPRKNLKDQGAAREATNDTFQELETDLERPLEVPSKRSAYLKKIFKKVFSFRFPHLALSKFPVSKKAVFLLGIGIVAVLGLLLMVIKVLPRATVILALQTKDWEYHDSIFTEKAAGLDVFKMTIPNQIFSQRKNVSLKFPATGKRLVEKKATGIITVYNSYSSDPQPLIDQTRFLSPDSKLFRLVKTITVPGAKIIEGKIVPSSIDTEVVADKAGPEYNIGPVKLFTIPGFRGSPKYQAFYGESRGEMGGGFIGEVKYPLPDDIKKAKVNTEKTLETALQTSLLTQIPKEFKLLDGSTSFKMLQQKVDEEVDTDGMFSLFSEAQLMAIAFKEEYLNQLLTQRAKKDLGEDLLVRNFQLEYGSPRLDFDKGLLSFPVRYQGTLVNAINADDLKAKLFGKSESELKTVIFGLPGIKSATVSLWPFWVKQVPNSIEKVEVLVE